MALSWDYEDVPGLVAQLSPPAAPDAAERALRRIYRAYGRELSRNPCQKAEQVRQELKALERALDGLSPRATNVLCAALDDRLFLPWPYDQAQAVINPCRDNVPVTRLEPAVRLRALRKAMDEALKDMPKDLRSGHKGNVSDATYKALHVLCLHYCCVHAEPYPSWDASAQETRHRGALDFAISCLNAWYAPDMLGWWADDLIRGLIHFRRKNYGQ
jgi:hypothetical protein